MKMKLFRVSVRDSADAEKKKGPKDKKANIEPRTTPSFQT